MQAHIYLGCALVCTIFAYVCAVKSQPSLWTTGSATDFYFLFAFLVSFGPTIHLHVVALRKLLSLPYNGGWRPLGTIMAVVLALTDICFSGYSLQLVSRPLDIGAWKYALEHQSLPTSPSSGGNKSIGDTTAFQEASTIKISEYVFVILALQRTTSFSRLTACFPRSNLLNFMAVATFLASLYVGLPVIYVVLSALCGDGGKLWPS